MFGVNNAYAATNAAALKIGYSTTTARLRPAGAEPCSWSRR